MSNFISISDYDATIHSEILDSLLREAATDTNAVLEVCENRAIAIVRSMLGARYDCDAIFHATGDARHVLILKVCLDIAVYEIFCQHNPYKMSKIRRERYEDAMQFLRDVRDHKANIEGVPTLPGEQAAANSPWLISSNTRREPHF